MALLSSIFFSAFIVISLSEASSYAHRSKNKTAAFSAVVVSEGGGEWVLLQKSIGVSAMHMQLLKNNRVIIFDRTNMGPSNLTFPKDKEYCLNYTIHNKPELVTDCTAHSLSYDVASNTIRPLVVRSDTWCSSGAVDPSGTLIQTGGFGNGSRSIRKVPACEDDTCDWTEQQQVNLVDNRWYASSQILPDGRAVVIGGRHVFSYEFYPKADGMSSEKYHLRFLVDTYDEKEENNLYPFLHLLPDGNLFLFANNQSILLDYNSNRVVKEFPVMPGGVKRNYPSTGSSVLLPLKMNAKLDGSGLPEAEVLICGGAQIGAFTRAKDKVFVGASTSCGRITVTDPDPKWVMETLPMPRVMPDMLLLPTGDVIIINGASKGTAGWENAINPVLNPVLYKTYEPNAESRFSTLNPSSIPRMYHSSAVLLPDGRVLVGGSNPHERYKFRAEFPTDLSLEAYNPPYLSPIFASLRPTIGSVESRTKTVSYGQSFGVKFQLPVYTNDSAKFSVALVTPSFTTHSFAMSQRMVVLDIVRFKHLYTRYKKPSAKYDYKIVARGPPKNTVAPPGYYMLFVIQAGIPSQATWVLTLKTLGKMQTTVHVRCLSGPHEMYNFRRAFPTELSLEAYLPPYLSPTSAPLRPMIISIETERNIISYGQEFSVHFALSVYNPDVAISVALVTPSFTTHSLAMNQRMVVLDVASLRRLSVFDYKITARGPPMTTVAPPGYYLIFIVHAGVPSRALWVKVQ